MAPPSRLSPEELRLFSDRIEKHLSEFPVLLDQQEHLQRVADLMTKVGGSSYYEILGVEPSASWQDIHEAYRTVASRVHPCQAYRLGMLGREGVFDMIFERVTEAYLVLSQPERRKQYDRELRPAALTSLTPEARAVEAKAVARRHFARAVWLSEADDFYFAVELLRQAVRLDGRPEYFSLLGRLEAKNPRWLHHAVEHLQHALDLGATDAGIPGALQEIRELMASGGAADREADVAGPRRAHSKDPDVEVIDPEDAEGNKLDLNLRRARRPKGR